MEYINRNEKVVFLTAFKGDKFTLLRSINNLLKVMDHNDIWIIVLDNLDFQNLVVDKRITILNNKQKPGAGNTRNIGLDYIISIGLNNFLLWPIDGDDSLTKNSRDLIVQKFRNQKYKMISFGCIQIYKKKQIKYSYSGKRTFRDLLKKYSTPCGSTVLRIENNKILKNLRFSKRKRANDQLFFLSAAKYFKSCELFEDIVLLNYCQNSKSLSSRKWKQPYYKFMALRDLKLNYFDIFNFFIRYLINNLSKILGYFKK